MEKSEAELRICVEKPRQNVEERDEMIGFMSRKADDEEDVKEAEIRGHGSKSRATFGRNVEEGGDLGDYCTDFSRTGRIRVSQGLDPVPEACFIERIMERNAAEVDRMAVLYGQRNDFGRDFLPSASVAWMERSSEWQQVCAWNGRVNGSRLFANTVPSEKDPLLGENLEKNVALKQDAAQGSISNPNCIFGVDPRQASFVLEKKKPMFLSKKWRNLLCSCNACTKFSVQKGHF